MSRIEIEIIPETKVSDFLKAFPEQEDFLISLAPAFRLLKNPVLRKTVARAATLAQAAKVGGITVAELVNSLRKAVGQSELNLELLKKNGMEKPEWVDKYKKIGTLDAREMIEKGEKPVDKVLASLDKLNEKEIFVLITDFRPAPLIDLASEKGFQSWSSEEEGVITTYFRKGVENE